MKISPDFENFDMQKCQGVSPSISRRDFYYSSLDLSCQDVSNGGQFMSLASLNGNLFAFCCFEFFENILLIFNCISLITLSIFSFPLVQFVKFPFKLSI